MEPAPLLPPKPFLPVLAPANLSKVWGSRRGAVREPKLKHGTFGGGRVHHQKSPAHFLGPELKAITINKISKLRPSQCMQTHRKLAEVDPASSYKFGYAFKSLLGCCVTKTLHAAGVVAAH